ncbi:MAG: hypothetical protein EOM16_07780 [Bacteroidia bacterium]|nr:hypothetical protein [Bacteroidia bacterium]
MMDKKIKILERNFDLYWQGLQPEITDQRFDQLMEELKTDCPDHPLLTKLGLNIPRGQEYIHETPMLSLDKVYLFSDLKKWIKKTARNGEEKYAVRYKFDGLAGKLKNQTLATRGDGKVGENISRHKNRISVVSSGKRTPLTISSKSFMLGELVVSYDEFEKFKVQEDRVYKHPRNFVAGMINQKSGWPAGLRIDFVEYNSSKSRSFYAEELTEDLWKEIVSSFNVEKQYPTDGLVINLEDREYANSLGHTSHHPNGSIAFKFYGDTVFTTLLDVEWGHGKGCLTPVGILEPVIIGGVTVSKVTLHNAKFMEDLDLAIGDEVEIERAGEVIPHILSRKHVGDGKNPFPNSCPSCGAKLIRQGVDIVCPNVYCGGTEFEQLRTGLECFEIDGLGETIIKHLYDRKIVVRPADIFKLLLLDILELPGFAALSAQKLYNSIQSKREMEESTILASLNTPGIGKLMYQKVLDIVPFEDLPNTELSTLSNIPGIGKTRAIAIRRSLKQNKPYLQELLTLVSIRKPVKKTGRTVCFTGKMEKPRKFYAEQAEAMGFQVVDKVSKDLDFLVTTEPDRKSSKMDAAKKLGIKIVTLEDWQK